MNKMSTLTVFIVLMEILFAGNASAVVPTVEDKGVAAITTCPTSPTGALIPATAYHSDKIVFTILGTLQAALAADQGALSKLLQNTEMDIKVRDNPRQVADIKSKVLSFLGAAVNPNNAGLIKIISVEYAAVVCPKSP
ncbi:MAG: hypothetical protein IPN42_00270 [Methylococcaceae bacterium]|nr:hypothetical protein [Methylococcaceae bacterium]